MTFKFTLDVKVVLITSLISLKLKKIKKMSFFSWLLDLKITTSTYFTSTDVKKSSQKVMF